MGKASCHDVPWTTGIPRFPPSQLQQGRGEQFPLAPPRRGDPIAQRTVAMDWRLRLLQLGPDHPRLLSCVFLVAQVALGSAALTLEGSVRCDAHLQGLIIPILVRIMLRTMVAFTITDFRGVGLGVHLLDILDCVGMAWFILVQARLFGDLECAVVTPWSFAFCCAFFVPGYFPLLCSLSVILRPPRGHPLRSLVLDWEGRIRFELVRWTPERPDESAGRWRVWLELHDCRERTIGDTTADQSATCSICLQLLTKNPLDSSRSVSTHSEPIPATSASMLTASFVEPKGADRVAPNDSPPIPGNNDDITPARADRATVEVVDYPCSFRHTFHVVCLHHWLQTCFERSHSSEMNSCPYCRQPPRLPPLEA